MKKISEEVASCKSKKDFEKLIINEIPKGILHELRNSFPYISGSLSLDDLKKEVNEL